MKRGYLSSENILSYLYVLLQLSCPKEKEFSPQKTQHTFKIAFGNAPGIVIMEWKENISLPVEKGGRCAKILEVVT